MKTPPEPGRLVKKNDASRSGHASLALRIAVASAIFGLLVAGGAMVAGFWTLSRQLDERAGMEMKGRKELLAHVLSSIPSLASVGAAEERFSELFYGHDNLHLALVDPSTGQVLAAFTDVASHSVIAIGHATAAPDTLHTWAEPGGTKFSGIHGIASVADGTRVQYYLSVDRRRDSGLLSGFVKATALALPLLLALVATGSWLIARMGLAPLRRFNQLAASVGTQSLDQRVSVAELPGELVDLATEFNSMLKRIDEGYRQLEDFAGDLAHEMRTPVATLLGRTQVALSQTRTAAELRSVLEGNVEELERLSKLVSDMLFIARADHESARLDVETVDLARETHTVAEYLSLTADERDLRIQITGTAARIMGERLLIQRAITNLLSNAIRHASSHSTIFVEICTTLRGTTLSVGNEGDEIPPEHIERIFERFYRADRGRGRGERGSGLGLAIVQSIVRLHGASVTVTSGQRGTTFTLSFPAPVGGRSRPPPC